MGNNQDQYENDPYIQASANANNPVNSFYTRSALVPIEAGRNVNPQQIAKTQEKKVTTAVKNPIQLDRNSIKLEKDAYDMNKYYIMFNYTCDKIVYGNVYFNVEFYDQPTGENQSYYKPSKAFENCVIKLTLEPGKNIQFKDSNLFIDFNYFLNNKIYDVKHTDVIIELFSLNQTNIECIFATFCKLMAKNGQYSIKPFLQKYKLMNSEWYGIEDIYGMASDDNLCEICCTNVRNTFFKPCMHSYACNECAVMLRMRGNGCPICRQPISDSVILETTNSTVQQ